MRAHTLKRRAKRAQAVAHAGVLPQIVVAMRVHAANAAVQELVCTALISITGGTDAQRDSRAQVVADVGALPQIVMAMNAHPASAAVQKQACAALLNITAGADAQRDACVQAAVDACALLPQIVAAMREHAANAAVQEKEFWALINIIGGNYVQGDARAQAAADAGTLPQIVVAMRAHAAKAAVQQQACSALVTIAAGNDAHQDARRAARAGGRQRMQARALNQIVAAMRVHAANATVQEQGQGAYRNLRAVSSPSSKEIVPVMEFSPRVLHSGRREREMRSIQLRWLKGEQRRCGVRGGRSSARPRGKSTQTACIRATRKQGRARIDP
ncbi:hypothetical protein T492DRAFT_1119441 [Pavlovales sp. CCMP2436]|nr:hypothetical protein T492DRAFT_1119441 [Pavlovales sp. CCMP2436]